MTEKKTSFTAEEEALIPEFFDKYLKQQTEQASVEDITEAVNTIWGDMDKSHPEIHIHESPVACKKACEEYKTANKKKKIEEFNSYWSIWFSSYAAMYDFADTIGLEMDQDKLKKFLLWSRCCPFILFNEQTVYVSRKPVEIHFNEDGQLHNDTGMSCSYADGWGIWTLNGVNVTEQIVMRPETLTLDDMRNEENLEVRRLMQERYGMVKYLEDVNAKLLHKNVNDVDGTKEFLYSADSSKFLMCICVSTGKHFCLEVRDNINTCEEAQEYLSSGLSNRIICST
jgi:hypothetical protein